MFPFVSINQSIGVKIIICLRYSPSLPTQVSKTEKQLIRAHPVAEQILHVHGN
jgi:hypothetical protein